ncbi:RluA family pseudouridine synthase [Puniceicoccales bacterium CK1056]|uniref:Pseudouridine synthase n=1 Tax=Oceanipulchritudo coccoides TaxID=2706888 RepID=A0A6B2M4I8_9BACT|nr:RluA family pseudouridine synthase [Oceanipulchritudo coccoides]NDV63014.1 RluA family pseudouridine synthase [Oceanipulchritudo coccoides]
MKAGREEDLSLTVPDDVRMARADRMLANLHPDLSRSRWQKLFQDGRVWMDDRVLRQKDKLRAGDAVQVSLPPIQPLELVPVDMDLDVLFEDENLLVLNKRAGVVVHPGAGTGSDTLVHGLLHHCKGSLHGIGGTERPGIVHRLDKETSGVMLVAKSEQAFHPLAEQFAERQVKKYYTALVARVPGAANGSIDQPIGRHAVHRTRMTCRADGRSALTDYSVIEAYGKAAALVRLQIHTGRTHQIRVHMKWLGHPILGDTLYGFRPALLPDTAKALDIPRVMLHATEIEFTHPVTNEIMRISTPLPEDFEDLQILLRKNYPVAESH